MPRIWETMGSLPPSATRYMVETVSFCPSLRILPRHWSWKLLDQSSSPKRMVEQRCWSPSIPRPLRRDMIKRLDSPEMNLSLEISFSLADSWPVQNTGLNSCRRVFQTS